MLYFAQQNLYAYFLKQKYGIVIQTSLLVQCHPNIEAATTSSDDLTLETQPTMTAAMLESFAAGWHNHVDSHNS